MWVRAANIRGQAAAVLRSQREPDTRGRLKANVGAERVALVLRDGEFARIRQLVGRVTSEKKATGNRSLADSGLIRVAQVAGKPSPVRHFEPQFLAKDAGFCEADGKTNAGVEEHVVIGIVVKITAKNVRVQPQFAEQRFGEATLIVVSVRGTHGKAHDDGSDRFELRRTREEEILYRRRLEHAVVGSVQQQVQRRQVMRNPEERAPA